MKKIFFLFIINVFCVSILSQSDWRWIAPNPPNIKPYSSVIVGNNIYFWCEYLRIMKMDIPSEEFKVLPVHPTNEFIGIDDFAQQGIAFADTMIGYITGSGYGEFRTTDGGLNWIKTAEAGSNIHIVSFASNRRGWKVGGGGLYITNNAGAGWSFVSATGLYGEGLFSKIFALNENHVFILKSSHYNGLGASILRSMNGGYSWVTINTGLQSDSLNQVKYSDLKIGASGIGYAIGSIYHPANSNYEGFILKTTDTGNSWAITRFPNELYKDVLIVNDSDCVILGNSGFYPNVHVIQRKSSNQGSSWILSLPFQPTYSWSYYYNAIYVPSKDVVYMVSTYGIYNSTNKGNSYFKLTSETDLIISHIAFDSKPVNNNKQLAIAWLQHNKKPYLISFDAGQTWKQKSLPASMGYIWLVGIAEEVIYLIVDQVRLFKSTDYGSTWKQLFVPVFSGLQALDVYSKDIFTLSAYKYLISSIDGGITWIKGPDVDDIWFEQTDISSIGTIIGVGKYFDSSSTRGAFYNTTDFGYSWHIFDTESEMKQASMVTQNIGYAIDNKKIYKTNNAGLSWKVMKTFGGCDAFAFQDSITGLLSSQNWFYKTTNGGVSWSSMYLGLPLSGVSKMTFNTSDDLFVIGGGALVMLPSTQSQIIQPYAGINSEHRFQLFQNYPNPFNPATRIRYQVSSASNVSLKVFDILGNEVVAIVDEYKPAGSYEVEFNLASSNWNLASGIYFYQLKAGDFIETKKMLLLK